MDLAYWLITCALVFAGHILIGLLLLLIYITFSHTCKKMGPEKLNKGFILLDSSVCITLLSTVVFGGM